MKPIVQKRITTKTKALEAIAEAIATCPVCRRDKVGLPVPGEGNPDADIVFLGEAPGKQEAKTGRPFIGPSGKILRQHITELGLAFEDVFITSPVKYLPSYVTPTNEDIAHGKIHLAEQLEIIDPKVIVLLGRVAALAMLGGKGPVLKTHGTFLEQDDRTYFLTIHPAAQLYSPKMAAVLSEDFKKLKNFLASKRSALPGAKKLAKGLF
jgi:DNA polymerase